MASSLFTLLAELSGNPKLLDRFHQDPESVMNDYGLSDEQKKAVLASLKDNKQHELHSALGDELHTQFGGQGPHANVC